MRSTSDHKVDALLLTEGRRGRSVTLARAGRFLVSLSIVVVVVIIIPVRFPFRYTNVTRRARENRQGLLGAMTSGVNAV
jgi:hypothetical protein